MYSAEGLRLRILISIGLLATLCCAAGAQDAEPPADEPMVETPIVEAPPPADAIPEEPALEATGPPECVVMLVDGRRVRGLFLERTDDTLSVRISGIDTTFDLTSVAAYDILAIDEAQCIIDAAMELLGTSGVVFEPGSQALQIFTDNGCDVSSDGIVRIAPELVYEALSSTAKTVKIWDRDGSDNIQIDRDHTCFFPGMTCIKVFDLETGEVRGSNREDLETITRVADALPNIDGVTIACICTGWSTFASCFRTEAGNP